MEQKGTPNVYHMAQQLELVQIEELLMDFNIGQRRLTIKKAIIDLTSEFKNLKARFIMMLLHGKVKYNNDDIVFYLDDRYTHSN